MRAFIRVLAVCLAIGALYVGGVALKSAFKDTAPANDLAVSNVLSDDELNADLAESAPQQQVVNGWTTRDLIAIEATRIGNIEAAQERTNELLGYAVAAAALVAALLALAILMPRTTTVVAEGSSAGFVPASPVRAPSPVVTPAVVTSAPVGGAAPIGP